MNDRKTLIGLNAAVFFMMLGVGMIVALLPQKILDFTSDSAKVGYLASAFALPYIALQLPAGKLADKYGFKAFLAAGYLLCFITGTVYYFSHSAAMVFTGRLLQGMGEAPVWAMAPALLSVKYPAAKGKVMGIYNATIHLGLTLGPLLGVLFLRLLRGNQFFLLYAGLCAAGALFIILFVDNPARNTGPGQHICLKGLISLAKGKETAMVLAGIVLYGAGYGAFLTNIPAFFINAGFGRPLISAYFSLFYISISISQIVTGPLSDTFGRKIFMVTGLYLSGTGILLFPRFGLPWLMAVVTAASIGLGIFYLSSMAYLNEIVPESLKGTVTGAYYLCWGLGFFFGPVIIGQLEKSPRGNTGFYAFSALLLMAAALMTPKPRHTNPGHGDGLPL